MTESTGNDSLVTIVDEDQSFIERHPILAMAGAATVGYLLGRYAGEEVLRASIKTASGSLSRHIEGLIPDFTER